jgi:putative NADH-flavin reductase/heme-degrading monooxygenase HmoA
MTASAGSQKPQHLFRIDKFKVPAAVRDEFLERVRLINQFLRVQRGFVQDAIFEQVGGPGSFNLITLVEWESAEAIEAAKKAAAARYAETGFNPQEFVARLGIEADLAVYSQTASAARTENMKLVVLGATGGIGIEIVKQAVERGHSVTALVRAPERLEAFRDRITIVSGDLLNKAELAKVFKGQDAVLSSFGPRDPRGSGRLLQPFATGLTSAMLQSGTRRVIVVSVAFLFKDMIIPPAYLVGRLLFGHHMTDASAMEEILKESGLDWTIVRPPQLTDKPRTGAYRVREGHLPRFGFTISRADVADFMIKAAENDSSVGRIVGVSN